MTKFLQSIREYAYKSHKDVNQYYGDNSYVYHLNKVYEVALLFQHLIKNNDHENVLAACFLHDIIEDARETYNDVLKKSNKIVAELVYALTNEKGRNRAERANDKYYAGIRAIDNASFIKMCDRIANVEFSLEQKSSMMSHKYLNENENFLSKLDTTGLEPMVLYLNELLQLELVTT